MRAQHRGPDEAAMVGRSQGQYPAHLLMAEDVGQEHRFLDRRQRVFRHIARRIMAAAEQTKLSYYSELIAEGDGLASGDSGAPSCYRLIESDLAVVAPPLRDKANETVEYELTTPVGDAHCALEAQELLRIPAQLVGGHCHHVGTGNEMSRSVSVAILT
jgi:hypothetical protein